MVILKKLQKQHKALGDALVHIETLEDAEALTTMEDNVHKFNEDVQVVKRKDPCHEPVYKHSQCMM